MKLISAVVVVLILSGCSTMTPVEMSPDQLHDQIFAGDVLSVGEKVKIVTVDGKTHKFKVSSITDVSIIGDDIEVPIADIIAVETKEFSGGKTAVLAGSTLLIYVLIASISLGVGFGM